MKRGCIIKTSALGDIVQAFSAFRLVKEKAPDIAVDWIIEKSSAPLLEGEKEINELIPIELKGKKSLLTLPAKISAIHKQLQGREYDFVLDLQGNIKSLLLLLFLQSKRKIGFGFSTVPEKINLLGTHERWNPPKGGNIREDYLFLIAKAAEIEPFPWPIKKKELPNQGKILLCPFSAWPNKELSTHALHHIIENLLSRGFSLSLMSGSASEQTRAERIAASTPKIELLPLMPLNEAKQKIGEFDLVISMDSFPLHLADLQGVPTYSFFGPSLAHKYGPLGAAHIQGSCPYGITFDKRCPYLRSCKTGACIKELDIVDIYPS